MTPAPATAPEVAPAAKLTKLPKLHIEKITKLEDIAAVIAKLNAQNPAGMQVQFKAEGENAEELKLASNFILNMPKELKASVELLKKLLTEGDPKKMTEEGFNKLLEKAKLEPSKMKDLNVSKSRTVDLSEKSGDALSLPAEIGGNPTALSRELTDLLKESLKYPNPPLVVVRAPNAEAGDTFLPSLGRWCKMHQESGFNDPIQDAFNLLRATKDDFNPTTASDTSLLSVKQLIDLAGVPVEAPPAATPPPPALSPNSVTPPSIDIGARELTDEETAAQKNLMQDLAQRFFTASKQKSPVQKDLNAIYKEIADIIEAGNGPDLQAIFLQGKNLKDSHKLVLAVDKAHWCSPTEISYVDFCDKDDKETVTWNKKKDDFAKIVEDDKNNLEICDKAEWQTWTFPAVLIMKSDGVNRSFAHINEL